MPPPAIDHETGGPQGGMRIAHERPAPETEPHVIAPLTLALRDGQRLTARKWSLRGISDTVLAGRDLSGARLEIPFQGVSVAFPVTLAASADGTFWAFQNLTGRQREALGLFYRNLLTGKMVATEDVITALDTPVDLIPMGETAQEKAAGLAKASPRALRMVWNLLYYTGLFLVVFGYLGALAWQRLDHVALSNARYIAAFADLAAPAAGFVAQVAAPAGTVVKAGDLLIRMTDPEAEARLAEVRAQVNQSEARLADARTRLETHLRTRPAARARAADTAQFDLDVSVMAGDFHDIRQRLEQEIRQNDMDMRALRAERGRLRDATRALEIRAPTDGRVERVLVRTDSYQRVGTPLMVFETDTPRQVLGWLDAAEAAHVWQGMRATVRYAVAGEMRSTPATITLIEAGTDPSRPDTYGLLVHLDLDGLGPVERQALLPHNAAVEVRLHRDLARRWLGIGG